MTEHPPAPPPEVRDTCSCRSSHWTVASTEVFRAVRCTIRTSVRGYLLSMTCPYSGSARLLTCGAPRRIPSTGYGGAGQGRRAGEREGEARAVRCRPQSTEGHGDPLGPVDDGEAGPKRGQLWPLRVAGHNAAGGGTGVGGTLGLDAAPPPPPSLLAGPLERGGEGGFCPPPPPRGDTWMCQVMIAIIPPPPCDIPLLFLYAALDSHPFFPSHVASGRCSLSAGAPAGVVSAFAEPSGWCAGAVPDVAGCGV